MTEPRTILGIDPGLANTGWGVVRQYGPRMECVAYGCVSTPAGVELSQRLAKIHEQISAVISRFDPVCLGIETVWFGQNITAAFATGQARGAALVACAQHGLSVGEFTPRQIKMAVVGTGSADKAQVQYMVKKLLNLQVEPKPDHASDALAAAICYTTHEGYGGVGGASALAKLESRGRVMRGGAQDLGGGCAMIAFLKGALAGKTAACAYIDVQGVGYAVGMSQGALSKLPAVGEPVQVHTYLQVSDNGIALYGFLTLEEKALFERLIGVSGVGPKVALAALSSFTPEALVAAVQAQDVAAVQKIPGVGKKTASRIILELKGSFDQGLASLFDVSGAPSSAAAAAAERLKGAREALLALGFASAEAEVALKGAPEDADENALIKYALKRLGK